MTSYFLDFHCFRKREREREGEREKVNSLQGSLFIPNFSYPSCFHNPELLSVKEFFGQKKEFFGQADCRNRTL